MTLQPPNAAGPDDIPADAALAGVPAGAFDRRVRSGRRIKAEHVRDYGIVVFVIGLFVYFSIASPVFLTSGNLLNLVYAERHRRDPRVRGHADDHRRQLRPLARRDLHARRGPVRVGGGALGRVVVLPGRDLLRRGDGPRQRRDHHEAAGQRVPRDAGDGARVHRASRSRPAAASRSSRRRAPASSPSSGRTRSGASNTRTSSSWSSPS